MSSYLTFYAKFKGDDKKHYILSYSRNNEIYQYFDDNLNIAYCGNEMKYTEITINDIELVLSNIKEYIDKGEKRLQEYEKHAAGNQECIEEIIQMKEYITDLYKTYYKILTIQDMISDINICGDIEHIYCNIG